MNGLVPGTVVRAGLVPDRRESERPHHRSGPTRRRIFGDAFDPLEARIAQVMPHLVVTETAVTLGP